MEEVNISAKEALDKLNTKLECAVCFNSYQEPKLLPCFHVFCKQCLEKLVVDDGSSLSCPTCRQVTPLPKGVSGLQSDFHVEHLFEIRDAFKKASKSEQENLCEKCKQHDAVVFCSNCNQFICDKCENLHQLFSELKSHQIVSMDQVREDAANMVRSSKQTLYCQKHPSEKLKIYCETCSELICSDCIIKLHKDHDYDLVVDVISKHKEEIVAYLQPLKPQLEEVDKGLQKFTAREKEITKQNETAKVKLREEFNEVCKLLEQRRIKLEAKLDQLTQKKLKILAAQKDHVEMLQAQLSSCLEHAEGGLRTCTEAEVLAMKEPVLRRVKQITTEVKTCLEPEEEANMTVVPTMKENIHKSCAQFVDIVEYECPGTKQICVLQHTRVGEQSNLTINVGHKEAIHLTAELIHKSSTNCAIQSRSEGNYEVSYRPIRVGKHKLHIKASGCDILGSPFPIVVSPSKEHLQKPSLVISDVKKPRALTMNCNRDIIVTEGVWKVGAIVVFSQDGKRRQLPESDDKIIDPYGVTMDSTGSMYVTDRHANRIHVFTPQQNLTKSVGSKGDGNLQFCHPVGINFNPKGNKFYVCDEENHRVQVLEKDLTFHSCLGKWGSGKGEFINPLYSAFDSKGNVYITDCYNDRVQVFTPDGQFIRSIQDKSCDQKLEHPYAIAIDSVDNVYVSERDRHCITIFDSDGQYVTSFGCGGDGEGQFNGVYGLHYDGSLFVSDYNNSRIFKFDMSL